MSRAPKLLKEILPNLVTEVYIIIQSATLSDYIFKNWIWFCLFLSLFLEYLSVFFVQSWRPWPWWTTFFLYVVRTWWYPQLTESTITSDEISQGFARVTCSHACDSCKRPTDSELWPWVVVTVEFKESRRGNLFKAGQGPSISGSTNPRGWQGTRIIQS